MNNTQTNHTRFSTDALIHHHTQTQTNITHAHTQEEKAAAAAQAADPISAMAEAAFRVGTLGDAKALGSAQPSLETPSSGAGEGRVCVCAV